MRLHLIGLWALLLISTGAAANPRAGLDQHALEKTCGHYENRARFMDISEATSLELVLALSCRAALTQITGLVGHSPYKDKRARVFLDRLTTYRATVIRLNTERFRANRAISVKHAGQHGLGAVTKSGEYLIAREMGVIAAYRDWVDATNPEELVALKY